jgi:hypothetical protein
LVVLIVDSGERLDLEYLINNAQELKDSFSKAVAFYRKEYIGRHHESMKLVLSDLSEICIHSPEELIKVRNELIKKHKSNGSFFMDESLGVCVSAGSDDWVGPVEAIPIRKINSTNWLDVYGYLRVNSDVKGVKK